MSTVGKVLFLGSKRLGLRVLQEMHALAPESLTGIITIDDSADTRSVLEELRSFARLNRIELHVVASRKQCEQLIESLKPDLCFVVGWYWLVSDAAIRRVPNGFIGIHNSLLPRYRGGSPLPWQIIAGEEEVGFSLFSFTEGMDDGPIWAQGSVSVEPDDGIADLLDKLEVKTLDVVRDTYVPILRGEVTPREQDHALATYCAQRYPEDGLIDWRMPARDVHNFIRAQSAPYPGAFTPYKDGVLRVWKARRFAPPYYGMPGQIARISGDDVYVVCGDNHALILEDVEWQGQRGKAAALITSIKSRLG